MSEITRYSPDLHEERTGEWVTYEDHARLLAEKEAEVAHAAEIDKELKA